MSPSSSNRPTIAGRLHPHHRRSPSSSESYHRRSSKTPNPQIDVCPKPQIPKLTHHRRSSSSPNRPTIAGCPQLQIAPPSPVVLIPKLAHHRRSSSSPNHSTIAHVCDIPEPPRFLRVALVAGELFCDPMHVTKGGWLGQTFALAKFDDSFEGKKSRIRRSKEERKGMVETFIKRYQKLNNGDFPSLALTRKEVGGSFYTVREIVREVIQENRILGPPKLPPGDQNVEKLDSFLEHYPLGLTSTDLHEHMVPPKDTQSLLKEYELRTSNVLNITERNEEVKIRGYTELLVEKGEEEHKGVMNDNNEERTDKESEHKNEGTKLENSRVSEVLVVETTHVTLSSEAFEKPKNTELLMEGDIEGQKDGVKTWNDSSTKESILLEEKNLNGAIRTNPHNLGSKNPCISLQHATLDDRTVNSNKSGGNSQKRRTNATLNRINLESWEAASRKSNGQDANRLVTFIKAFITAFVKFWSE